jgi:hypothetical protein
VSVVLDIARTYRAPREVQARRMSGPPREDRALAVLLGACLLIFIAQLPRLSREAFFDPSIPFDARMSGALFGWMMVMPLVFYGISLIVTVLLSMTGRPVAGGRVRVALFWALLASTPLWLLTGLMQGFAAESAGPVIGGVLALGSFLFFAGCGLVAARHSGQEAAA